MPFRDSVPDTFTLAANYKSQVINCSTLRDKRSGSRRAAAPRMHDALTELDYILEDQLAALANAIDDDNADAEADPVHVGRLMAARPVWRGHLRLALVSCPVALYNARHDRAGIRFNLINPETGNRIRMITQDAETGHELERRSLVKGYEFRKGKYLLLSDDDLDSVKVDSSSVMTIEKFVDTASIDPVYYDSAYFLVPDGETGKDVYAVLREAIAKTGKTALSRVVIAQRERTIALRPMGDGLMAHTLYEDRDLNTQTVRRPGRHQDRSGDGAARHAARAAAIRQIRLQRILRTATKSGCTR